MQELVSILIPCRNEEGFIATTLDNLLGQDYPRERMEIFVIDGRSTDRTREIVSEYAQREPSVQLLDNPEGIVPFALNKAIKKAKGSVILRMDAHSEYPQNYVSRLVQVLIETGADNVGGVWDTQPASEAPMAQAIALATSHPFGIGNASYRLGAAEIKEVDTVPYGCYRRDVFDRIGDFDEELVRNQDDEFNARLIQNGGKILLVPDLFIRYFARPTLPKMMKMFYQYGYYKPLVNMKLKQPATWRQFIPLGFVAGTLIALWGILLPLLIALGMRVINGQIDLTLFSLGLLVLLQFSLLALIGAWTLYGLANVLVSIKLAIDKKRPGLLPLFPIVFLMIHWSYGWGYLKGIFFHKILKKKGNHRKAEISR